MDRSRVSEHGWQSSVKYVGADSWTTRYIMYITRYTMHSATSSCFAAGLIYLDSTHYRHQGFVLNLNNFRHFITNVYCHHSNMELSTLYQFVVTGENRSQSKSQPHSVIIYTKISRRWQPTSTHNQRNDIKLSYWNRIWEFLNADKTA